MGNAWINPSAGNRPTSWSAEQIVGMQEISFNRTAKMVPLKGSNQFPDAVAIADKEVKGKMKVGRFDGDFLNNAMFGENPTTDAPIWYPLEAHTVPPSTTYTVTVTNHSTFAADYGVRYTNGQPFTNMQGATLTAKGQYNVTAGVYTFYSGDAAAAVAISYQGTSTTGSVFTEHNQLQGWGPIVQLALWEPYSTNLNQSANNGIFFSAVVFGGINGPFKRDDWIYLELDWEAYPDPNNNNLVWQVVDGGGSGA